MQKIGVVGCGLMGAGIAEVCARAGLDVVVAESTRPGRGRRPRAAGAVAAAGRVAREDRQTPPRCWSGSGWSPTSTSWPTGDLVVEAIVEDEAAKTDLFARLDKIVESPDAVLASNTSSIPIMKLAVATSPAEPRAGRALLQPGAGAVAGRAGAQPADRRRRRPSGPAPSCEGSLGKHAIDCQDRAGFVVNALLIPFVLSAIRMLESGFATAEDIDQGLVRGAAHPQGPLALADLIGLDTTKAVAESLYEEFKEPLYAPPPLLARMVDAGLLGRKTGRGFYTYN